MKNIDGLKGINLEVHQGEVLGIAGVDGNGQTELLEVLTGLRKVTSGEITLNNEDITKLSPRKIKEKKIAKAAKYGSKGNYVWYLSLGSSSANKKAEKAIKKLL